MGHVGVGWVMQGCGGSCRGGVGWVMQGWGGSCRGWVMQGWGGVGHVGVGHVGVGWGGSCRVGWSGSCRGGVGHAGMGVSNLAEVLDSLPQLATTKENMITKCTFIMTIKNSSHCNHKTRV